MRHVSKRVLLLCAAALAVGCNGNILASSEDGSGSQDLNEDGGSQQDDGDGDGDGDGDDDDDSDDDNSDEQGGEDSLDAGLFDGAVPEPQLGDGGLIPFDSSVVTPGEDSAVAVPFGMDERPTNATCVAPEKPQLDSSIALQRVFPNLKLDRPLALLQAPGDHTHFFFIEQTGALRRFPNTNNVSNDDAEVVLSVNELFPGSFDERGLLGVAFHPEFVSNGYVFVHYIAPDGASGTSTIERYTWNDVQEQFDASSRKSILTLKQPFANHNGGNLAFGPDGFLYIGFGDGGSQDDPSNNGQNTGVLFAKMLRIDINSSGPYAIPASNPFASSGGGERKEIFAVGLRNPWRYSFDRETGELWVGDVGGGCFEEVNLVERGKNYGWDVREGFGCRNDRCDNSGCASAGFTDPVAVIQRNDGQSITGGYVYRGSAMPGFVGTYVYGDYMTGRVWGLKRNGSSVDARELLNTELSISSFGEDLEGELYVVQRGAEANQGQFYRIVPANSSATDTLPKRLSETGCVNPDNPRETLPALIPYDLRVPFWSDGADKSRFLALPDGTNIEVGADGDWVLPPGAVTVKTFALAGRRIETRFFVRYADGSYGGYTYRWRDDQSDADLLTDAETVSVDGQEWTIPSPAQCERCHHPVAGSSLGLESIQLDRLQTYPSTGRTANQLDTLAHIGWLAQTPVHPDAPLPPLDSSASVDARAKAWLHANCSNCHRPGGPGRGSADFRFGSADMGVCNSEPIEGDLGVSGARLLIPGDASRSLMYLRAARRGLGQMPPLASHVVDEQGAALLKGWIDGLAACP